MRKCKNCGAPINDDMCSVGLEPLVRRDGNLEIRTCNKQLLNQKPHTTAEIVEWTNGSDNMEHCFTVAYWVEHKEGYDLKFIGNRPFEVEGREWFWILAKLGQEHLMEYFNSRA